MCTSRQAESLKKTKKMIATLFSGESSKDLVNFLFANRFCALKVAISFISERKSMSLKDPFSQGFDPAFASQCVTFLCYRNT